MLLERKNLSFIPIFDVTFLLAAVKFWSVICRIAVL